MARALSSSELVSLWDTALDQAPPSRALAILSAADPKSTPDDLANLSLGERDRRLLKLRQCQFDRKLTGNALCPNCGERLEVELDTEALTMPPADANELSIEQDGWKVWFRLPTSRDLVNLPASPPAARERLLECCISNVEPPLSCPLGTRLPETVANAVEIRMSEADPQSQIQLNLTCAVCDLPWSTEFDIASFFWTEIEAMAASLLSDVHQIAAVYHWNEREILALSPRRRAFYLHQIGA